MKEITAVKKYMIRCDMEGVSGIVSYEQSVPGASEYAEGREYFMSDLLAAVTGLHDGGADEVHIYDEHFYGRNIFLDRLPEYAFSYCGKPNYTIASAGGLDGSFDGLVLLGFHSKAGTTGALLNHSYESDIKDILLNGTSVGEIGMETAVAGSFNVPLVLITADSEGIAEAKKLFPNVAGVTVKESLSETGALCYPIEKTFRLIYEAAKKVVQSPPPVIPMSFDAVTLEFAFNDTPYAEKYLKKYGNTISGATANQCWATYLFRKTEVLKTL